MGIAFSSINRLSLEITLFVPHRLQKLIVQLINDCNNCRMFAVSNKLHPNSLETRMVQQSRQYEKDVFDIVFLPKFL